MKFLHKMALSMLVLALSMMVASPTSAVTTTATLSIPGTWKVIPSPNVGTGTFGNQLNGVAVVSANDVWAVGFSPAPSGMPLYIRQTLIEHWNSTNWSVVPSPNPPASDDVRLNGVTAISANDIWAVGHSGNNCCAPYQTLTIHWNGTRWSIIPSPSPGTYLGNDLTAVAAISANDAWAVGEYRSGQSGQLGGALIMHWDGTSWKVVPNPSKSRLYAITAISAKDVWAVGDEQIMHWNGTGWSIVSFPKFPSQFTSLRGISAVSAGDVWAVGYRQFTYFSGYRTYPVTYHWNGTTWSLVYNAGGIDEYLFGVDTISTNDVWAVGQNGKFQHWDGTSWSAVAAPYLGIGGTFNGVTAISASDVWAVGWYVNNNGAIQTLIDRYTVP